MCWHLFTQMKDHRFSANALKFSLCSMLLLKSSKIVLSHDWCKANISCSAGPNIPSQEHFWASCHTNAVSQRLAKPAGTQCGDSLRGVLYAGFYHTRVFRSQFLADLEVRWCRWKLNGNVPGSTGWDRNMWTMKCLKDIMFSALSVSTSVSSLQPRFLIHSICTTSIFQQWTLPGLKVHPNSKSNHKTINQYRLQRTSL